MRSAWLLMILSLGCGAAGGRTASSGCRDPNGQPSQLTVADTNIAGFYSAVGGGTTISGSNQGRLLIGLGDLENALRTTKRLPEQAGTSTSGGSPRSSASCSRTRVNML